MGTRQTCYVLRTFPHLSALTNFTEICTDRYQMWYHSSCYRTGTRCGTLQLLPYRYQMYTPVVTVPVPDVVHSSCYRIGTRCGTLQLLPFRYQMWYTPIVTVPVPDVVPLQLLPYRYQMWYTPVVTVPVPDVVHSNCYRTGTRCGTTPVVTVPVPDVVHSSCYRTGTRCGTLQLLHKSSTDAQRRLSQAPRLLSTTTTQTRLALRSCSAALQAP